MRRAIHERKAGRDREEYIGGVKPMCRKVGRAGVIHFRCAYERREAKDSDKEQVRCAILGRGQNGKRRLLLLASCAPDWSYLRVCIGEIISLARASLCHYTEVAGRQSCRVRNKMRSCCPCWWLGVRCLGRPCHVAVRLPCLCEIVVAQCRITRHGLVWSMGSNKYTAAVLC